MKTAEEIFQEIRDLESTERFKLVRNLTEFTKKPDDNQSEFIIELIEELSKVKQDIEFISKKLGIHDLYIDRLTKQIEKKYFDKE